MNILSKISPYLFSISIAWGLLFFIGTSTPVFADSFSPMDADSLKHEIGTVVKDTSAFHKEALFGDTKKDKYGNLVYGNTVDLKSGTYDIEFSLKTDLVNLPDVIANIGVEPEKESIEGYYREISWKDFGTAGIYKKISLTFKLDKEATIIPYLYMVGTANLWVDSVTIKQSKDIIRYPLSGTGEYTYEESDLLRSVGAIAIDPTASNKQVSVATIRNDSYGFLSFGPYSKNEAVGNHQAIFRLKTNDNDNDKIIAKIEIFNSEGSGVNKFRKLRWSDFYKSNTFQDFPIEYARTDSWSMEFKVLFYDSGSLALDHVRSKGEFIRKTPPRFSDFRASFDQATDKVLVSFASDEKLLANPEVTIGKYSLVFQSKSDSNYNYSFDGAASLGNGVFPIMLQWASDYFGNNVSFVILWDAEILLKDTVPPDITDISLSQKEANSFELFQIQFSVNEPLGSIPVVMVGENPAMYISGSGTNAYIFEYTVNDYSSSLADLSKVITVSVTDRSGNTGIDTKESILLHINNTNLTEESENLPWSVGEILVDEFASNKLSRHSSREVGYLQFGPYSDNITHNSFHVAKFRLKTKDNNSSQIFATIDVVNANGEGERVYKHIRGSDFLKNDSYQDFELRFFRTNSGIMEYRVYVSGMGDISSDSVTIVDPEKTANEAYESEDLYGVVWTVVKDPTASNGTAIRAEVWVDVPGTFQFGPYRTALKNGSSYTARFRMKTDVNASANPVALIDVYDSITGYREYREIKATDFDLANTYQDFDVDFMKPFSDNVEFRVFFYGKQDIWADKVEITEILKTKLPDYETENLPGISGSVIVDPDASGQLARKSRVGVDNEWAMQFGPYDATNLIDGNPYKAVFRMKVPENTSQDFIALIDVYNGDVGYRKYREIKAVDFNTSNVYQDFEINFTKPLWSKNMEYRIFFYGKQDLTADNVTVWEGVYEGLPVFESESLPSKVGTVVRDSLASGWKVIAFDKNRFPEGWAQFGPYKIDNVVVGENYRANFVLRTDDTTNTETIAVINIYNSDKSINYNLSVKWTDFSVANAFQDFFLDFPMLDKELMEFRVFATGKGNFSIDKIYITK